jgi:hypothetical protein
MEMIIMRHFKLFSYLALTFLEDVGAPGPGGSAQAGASHRVYSPARTDLLVTEGTVCRTRGWRRHRLA